MSLPRPIATAAALAVALALPIPAGAAEPFGLDPDGDAPHVAVAENGTGHFVWGVSQSETASRLEEVRYCQVPRGATACAKTQRFEGVDGPGAEGPRVLLHRDGRVIIIGERGTERVSIVSSGWALLGDAGYHKNPITAMGINDAFRDAELVAGAQLVPTPAAPSLEWCPGFGSVEPFENAPVRIRT